MAYTRDVTRLSIGQLAWLAGKGQKTATRMLRESGLPPLSEDGRAVFYDPRKALKILLGVGVEQGLQPMEERARLDRMRADLAEQEYKKRTGELMERAELMAHFGPQILTAKERLRAVPAAATVHIPGFTQVMARLLVRLIDEALTEIADGGEPKPGRGGARKRAARAVETAA